ncbi:MAG: zinc-ribbon domain-containing protein [Acidobacteriota bacterium]
MEDKTIVCVDCHQPFVFTTGEQQFYSERGLAEIPKRCKACRSARRRRLGRRRRHGGADVAADTHHEVLDAEATADGAAATGEESPGSAPAPPTTSPVAHEPVARSFWEERPQWVRDALEKSALPRVPRNGTARDVEQESNDLVAAAFALAGNGNGNGNGNGTMLKGVKPLEPRRRRRRRSRRRKKGVAAHGETSAPLGD